MILYLFGKEWIVVNEEIAIYLSFLIVLTILINNLGGTVVTSFTEQKNKISSSYSIGSEELEKGLKANTNNSIKTGYYIISELLLQNLRIKKFLKLTDIVLARLIRL